MNAEEYIKSHLDGNFWSVDTETMKVVHSRVSKDYQPVFKTQFVYVPPASRNHPGQKPWTAEEDEMLFTLRQKKTPWHDIQKAMHRGIANLRPRYERLCADRGLSPHLGRPARAHTTWPEELKADILRMRYANIAIKAIARKTSVSAFTIRDFLEDCAPDMIEARTETLKKRFVKSSHTLSSLDEVA